MYNPCLKWFFGLVVVLNGGKKNYIEKILGFRGNTVHFFKAMFFFLPSLGHHSSKLSDSKF